MSAGTYDWMQQWHWYMQQAYERNEQLLKQVEALEARIKSLEGKLDQYKPVHIETINYKVQELHVQELSGTLVAGLSALAEGEAVQKWLSEEGSGEVQLTDLDSDNTHTATMTEQADRV